MGIEKRRIFENSGDRDNFFPRLANILKETKTAKIFKKSGEIILSN